MRQAIIWTNAGILLFGPPRTNFSVILIEIQKCLVKENPPEHVVRKIAAIFFSASMC